MARVPHRESLSLLEAAYATGIRHFDVARSYGYGAAESVLGDFLATRRAMVTVTTKFGIRPPRASPALQAAKAVARAVVALRPGLRARVRKQAGKLVKGGYFSVAEARASLETSLRELRTDYVDILLLHECATADVEAPGLLSFLESSVQQGKIRYFGIATDNRTARETVARKPQFGAVVQSEWAPYSSDSPEALGGWHGTLIAHSVLGRWLSLITRHLDREQGRASYWSERCGVDCRDRGLLAGLLLRCASRSTGSGLVLFSSQRQDHIAMNAGTVREEPIQGELHAVVSLLRESAGASRVQGAAG
jgi:hypothetical protein